MSWRRCAAAPTASPRAAASAPPGAIAFSLSLCLVAGADVETFYLRSSSDPGVQVLAQVGNAPAQVVIQTDTLSAWNPS